MLRVIRFMLSITAMIFISCATDSGRDFGGEESSYYRSEEKKSKCGPVDVIMQDDSPRQRVRSEEVDIYSDQADVSYETRTIASLTTKGGVGNAESDLVARIRCKAAELGADGIIWSSEPYEGNLSEILGVSPLFNKNRLIRAKAIVYIARK